MNTNNNTNSNVKKQYNCNDDDYDDDDEEEEEEEDYNDDIIKMMMINDAFLWVTNQFDNVILLFQSTYGKPIRVSIGTIGISFYYISLQYITYPLNLATKSDCRRRWIRI